MDTEAEIKKPLSRFVVMPNCSMSWQENKLFVASLAFISFSIAGAFALQGFWVILPFAGLEILMLTGILYWSGLQSTHREVISIGDYNIHVEVGRNKSRQTYEFQRVWTKVELRPPALPSRQTRLIMRSKGKELEIGACLTEQEREGLATSLKKALSKTD